MTVPAIVMDLLKNLQLTVVVFSEEMHLISNIHNNDFCDLKEVSKAGTKNATIIRGLGVVWASLKYAAT